MRRVISEKKLSCGGTALRFHGKPKPASKARLRRAARPITDKRHFAGVKAHDTKLHREATRLGMLAGEALAKACPEGNKRRLALARLLDLCRRMDKQFGWDISKEMP